VEELNELEIMYIMKYDTCNKNIGYNIHEGGRNCIPGEETRLKMSQSHKGIIQSDEWLDKRIHKSGSINAKKYGKLKTEEEKNNISIKTKGENSFWYGKTRSKETKDKISEKKKGTTLKESARLAICKTIYLIDIKNNKYTEYESGKLLSSQTGIKTTTISYRCKKDYIDENSIKWSYNKPE
jgi:group I intron endonuclease